MTWNLSHRVLQRMALTYRLSARLVESGKTSTTTQDRRLGCGNHQERSPPKFGALGQLPLDDIVRWWCPPQVGACAPLPTYLCKSELRTESPLPSPVRPESPSQFHELGSSYPVLGLPSLTPATIGPSPRPRATEAVPWHSSSLWAPAANNLESPALLFAFQSVS